jgi:ABC-type dipeptide/oligopeptide/nickel transport system permease component
MGRLWSMSQRHRLARYIGLRVLLLIPQLLGITFVTFILIRLLPGDPAYLLAGPTATKATIAQIRRSLGLNRPLLVQFWLYLDDLVHGNLGQSFRTGKPVLYDVLHRLPATLELVVPTLAIGLALGIALGVYAAFHEGSRTERLLSIYARLAGSLPEWWLGLILIFIFYFKLRWAPPPLGRLGITTTPPTSITNSYVLDSLFTGNWAALQSALSHLVLPILTFSVAAVAPFMKMTRATMIETLNSDYIRNAAALGLPRRAITRTALKNSLPPVVTLAGFLSSYLIGGSVLIETVFSWGGFGQYAVQSLVNSDYAALQGFVLVSALFTLAVYFIVDLLYLALDPRIQY